jgi:hypothetical protein
MSSIDLVARLRAAGDPLHLLAAEALVAWYAEVERLRARALQLEAVARLTGGPPPRAGFWRNTSPRL